MTAPTGLDLNNPASSPLASVALSKPNLQKLVPPPLPAGTPESTGAGLLGDAAASPDWQQAAKAHATAYNAEMLARAQAQIVTLQNLASSRANELNQRITAIQAQMTGVQNAARINAAPPALTASPSSFQIGIKVVEQKSRLGLQGLTVRLNTGGTQATSLPTAKTDSNGNAVLAVTKAEIENHGNAGATLSIEILTPAGNSVHMGAQVISPSANQVAGIDISLPATEDILPHVKMATAMQAGQEAQLVTLNAKAGLLQASYQQKQVNLQANISHLQAIVANLAPSPG